MPSDDGSTGPLPDDLKEPFPHRVWRWGTSTPPASESHEDKLFAAAARRDELTVAEQDALADGEPYCFRCGRPASSFTEYGDFTGTPGMIAGDRARYVREQEGTYNPDTNRFACDACYIAIGMPSGPTGWMAP